MCVSGSQLSIDIGHELSAVESKITLVTWLMVSVLVLCFAPESQATHVAKAMLWQLIDEALDDANLALRSVSPAYVEAPITATPAFLKQWLATAGTFVDLLKGFILNGIASDIQQQSSKIDQTCPRWGDVCNDSEFNEPGCRLQLVTNPNLPSLPSMCRELHNSLADMTRVSTLLKGSDDADERVREAICLGQSSLTFGVKTVNVSAAAKVVCSPKVSAKQLDAVMSFKSSLPAALANRLDALRRPDVAASGASSTTSSAPPASSDAMKRSRSQTDLGPDGAKPPKRR